MKVRVFTIVLLLAVCSGFQTRTTRVAGVVIDVNDARIVGATITVANTEVKELPDLMTKENLKSTCRRALIRSRLSNPDSRNFDAQDSTSTPTRLN